MNKATENQAVIIKKASGDTEAFDVRKLIRSLKNAGADEAAITDIVEDIQSWVYDGVSTAKIYARAYKAYRQRSLSGALLYKLKMALNSMGPSGHPFEHFIGELFRAQGYDVKVALVMQGASINHEMDVIATKAKELTLMECKYSEKQGHTVSIQVPLYVHSRVNDIVEKLQEQDQYKDMSFCAGVVTNGRFSPDSMEYSRCKDIRLLGWDFPKDQGIKNLMETLKIFPITILTNLNKEDKQRLMAEGIVTCSLLGKHPGMLEKLGLSKEKQRSVAKELAALDEVKRKHHSE